MENVMSRQAGQRELALVYGLLLLVAVVWGTSYGVTKIALAYISISLFISLRFGITFILLLPGFLKDFRQGLNRDWIYVLPTGFILSAIFHCEVTGIYHTTAANAAVLISLSAMMTLVLDCVLFRQRESVLLWVFTAISVIGVVMLVHDKEFQFTLNHGDGYILAAAGLRALMVTVTRVLQKNRQVSTRSITAIQSLLVTICFVCFTLVQGQTLQFPSDSQFWLWMIYLVVACTLFAFYVQNLALKSISSTRVSMILGSEPLFGVLFALLLLHEQLSTTQALGALLIIVSVSAAIFTSKSTRN